MQVLTTTVARVLFATPFVVFGLMHFGAGAQMAGMIPSWLPGGVFWIYLTGLTNLLAGVAIIAKKKGELVCKLLSLQLLVFILLIHVPGLGNEATMQMAMASLLKDLGLLGGALTYVRLFASNQV